jgi:hypothetical protein
MTQPTSGGTNSIIVCHDIGMMFARPARAVVTSTTGPDSSNRYASASGNALFFTPAISQFSFEGTVQYCGEQRIQLAGGLGLHALLCQG